MEDLESTEGLDWERVATKVAIFAFIPYQILVHYHPGQ